MSVQLHPTRQSLAFFAGLDAEQSAAAFARTGRLQLRDVLDNVDIQAIHDDVAEGLPWRRSMLSQGRNFTMPLSELDRQPQVWREAADKTLRLQAGSEFNYLFDTYPLSDEIEAGRRLGRPFEAVYDAMNSAPFLDFVNQLTGGPRGVYCDAQVTRYTAGQFLTEHDDEIAGQDRLFAYVLNLTPAWKADWGGLLLFVEDGGHVAEGFTPTMNTLSIFRVPQPHCVSEVASYALAPRLSITGWIRSRRP